MGVLLVLVTAVQAIRDIVARQVHLDAHSTEAPEPSVITPRVVCRGKKPKIWGVFRETQEIHCARLISDAALSRCLLDAMTSWKPATDSGRPQHATKGDTHLYLKATGLSSAQREPRIDVRGAKSRSEKMKWIKLCACGAKMFEKIIFWMIRCTSLKGPVPALEAAPPSSLNSSSPKFQSSNVLTGEYLMRLEQSL